ncbi:MAG TPA: hypothetical protein VM141_00885 [Planctomycetota bacterium]|nr:hypothetical protein [Planctomycetota bacterium]
MKSYWLQGEGAAEVADAESFRLYPFETPADSSENKPRAHRRSNCVGQSWLAGIPDENPQKSS